MKKNKDWQERFEEKFGLDIDAGLDRLYGVSIKEDVKDFIQEELDRQREEIVEEQVERLESLKTREYGFRRDINDGYGAEVQREIMDKAIKQIKK